MEKHKLDALVLATLTVALTIALWLSVDGLVKDTRDARASCRATHEEALEAPLRAPARELEPGVLRRAPPPLNTDEPHAAQGDPARGVCELPCETGLVGVLAELEEPWRPTPEGLFLRTSDLWAQEDFLNLSPARMRALLPLDDDLALLPESMDLRSLIGADLPTLDDCRRGLYDEAAKQMLEQLIVVEATYSALCETPASERTRDRRAILTRLAAERDVAEEALMQRLNAVTTYRHWALLSRLHLEWQR